MLNNVTATKPNNSDNMGFLINGTHKTLATAIKCNTPKNIQFALKK
jgi:hypothetical protein|tara:strand:- start:695 stop:832 length:138 start_codon:yes stop_codon:yes gene_type:complete